jgi:uncharacterized membrane protein YgcG
MKNRRSFMVKFAIIAVMLGLFSPSVKVVESEKVNVNAHSLLSTTITFSILNKADARRGGGRRGGGGMRRGGGMRGGGMRRSGGSFRGGGARRSGSFNRRSGGFNRRTSPRHNRYQGGNFQRSTKRPSYRMSTRPPN